jgi:hypothetical protein
LGFFALGSILYGDSTIGIVEKNLTNEHINSDIYGLTQIFE